MCKFRIQYLICFKEKLTFVESLLSRHDSCVQMFERMLLKWILTLSCLMTRSTEARICSGSRCGDCLINDGCVWCKDPGFSSTRCGLLSNIQNTGCLNIVQRKPHNVTIIEDKKFSDGGPGMDPIQIRPQKMKIRLVPNETLKIMVYYKIARNFPLDIYFLHDPSYSMSKLLTSLRRLTSDIASDLYNLTTDYRFGFGTSMDKEIEPFTNTSEYRKIYPCGTDRLQCERPYSFLHRLALTSNLSAFKDTLNNVGKTGNQDEVEGLFDGLMQVMVCGNKIGWRHKARRMIIYATDIHFHQAGDGRVAGILEPNDGLCHLDDDGKYTKAEIQDYPSVGQIIQKARENNINLIFVIGGSDTAVVSSQCYDPLTKFLPGEIRKSFPLDINATNILEIIRESYKRLRESIKLSTSGIPKEIDLGIYTNCRTGGRVPDKTNICEGLDFDTWANFTIYIDSNLNACPKENSVNMTIFPEGLEDRVQIMLDYNCECDCQREPEAEPNSTKCSGRGTYECGVCHCQEGWSGEECDCDQRGTEEEACGTEAGICSNAGNCTCNKCDCFEGYSGEKCACNDQTCPRHNGSLCGGPEHGRCSCGQCVCTSEYSGPACDCRITEDLCKNQNGTICSDHGQCICGKCQCDAGFHGKLCDICHPCPGSCTRNFDCAECVGFGQGEYNQTVCNEKCRNVEIVSYLETEAAGFNESYMSCVLKDSLGCIIYFSVYEKKDGEAVKVKETKRCPPGPINPLTIGLGVSGAVFLVALVVLIIWKLLTLLYDKVEFSMFKTEIENPDWEKSDNPLYKSCVTIVQNPVRDTSRYEKLKFDNAAFDDVSLNRKSSEFDEDKEKKTKSVHFVDDLQ
uniref:Integrin beta n=1 Tax=Crassostrea virginica TaxID=6565 RepID=A0A8B8BT78_CRAVI|nr:integrin beta-3-like [Crassostrea virginica]